MTIKKEKEKIKEKMKRIDKGKALEKIAKEIEECKVCKIRKSGKSVVGEGNPDAKIVFIEEASGRKEAETGRPLVGRSGQLLRSLTSYSFFVNILPYGYCIRKWKNS